MRMMRRATTYLLAAVLVFSFQAALFASEDAETRSKSLASYAIGVMHDLYGQTDLAIEKFKQAAQYEDNYAIRLRLGADYARLGKLSLAVHDLKKALEYDPQNVQARYLLALIYSTQKDYDSAAKEYENILTSFAEAEPENVEIYGYLAQLYYSQKQYDKAIQQFEAVLSIDPQNTDVMFLLGALYLEIGDEDQAIALFKRTLKLKPDHDACLNSLGYVYADKGINLDEAETLIKRALEIDPNNGAYMDSLGWVYFRKGDNDLALKYLHQAESLTDDPVIFDHLGDVYAALDNAEQAKYYWEKSLGLLPDQQEVTAKIESLE